MKAEKEIRARLAKIESDERLGYPCADVHINAPLALIQISLESASALLRWVLDEAPRGENKPKPEPATGQDA